MTDRDRLRILADQGDPIAIGQLYREAKRRGEAVVCVSQVRQDLPAPPPPADEWAWLLPHVVGWAEQMGCRLDMLEWAAHLSREIPPRFDRHRGWVEVTGRVRLMRYRKEPMSGWVWGGVFTSDLTASIDGKTGERAVRLEGMWGLEGLVPWDGGYIESSIETTSDWHTPSANGGDPCGRPISDDILTATGRDLDRLAFDFYRDRRNQGESDASLRERLLVREWSASR